MCPHREKLESFFTATPMPPLEKEINGTEIANAAVAACPPDQTLIFLIKEAYDDLCYRANLAELKTYRRKTIVIISN